jgi:hypothetical protein
MRLLRVRLLFALTAATGLGLAAGCSRPAPTIEPPRLKLLILDFRPSVGIRENPREIVGWWIGARTVYQNPRAGETFAERLTARLARQSYLTLFSRIHLKYYFAEVRQAMRDRWGYLSDEEIERLIEETPAGDFARKLGADKVLSGRLIQNRLTENRTIHVWWSVVEADCQIADAATGEVEWRKRYRLKRWFASQLDVQDELAQLIAEDLGRLYFPSLSDGDSF